MTSQAAYVISSGKVVGPRNETENVISSRASAFTLILSKNVHDTDPYSSKPL